MFIRPNTTPVRPLEDIEDENSRPTPQSDREGEPQSSTLEWVNVDHPETGLNARQLATVRSHVMRRYRQEQEQLRIEKEARILSKEQTVIHDTALSMHQSEALKPELNALAQALGLDLETGDRESPRNIFASVHSRSDKRRRPNTNWKTFKPETSGTLGYSPVPGEEYDAPVIYCIICGSPGCTLHRSSGRNKGRQAMRQGRTPFSSNFEPSPRELLGAGRVNPFVGSYPVDEPKPYVHELMDHGMLTIFHLPSH